MSDSSRPVKNLGYHLYGSADLICQNGRLGGPSKLITAHFARRDEDRPEVLPRPIGIANRVFPATIELDNAASSPIDHLFLASRFVRRRYPHAYIGSDVVVNTLATDLADLRHNADGVHARIAAVALDPAQTFSVIAHPAGPAGSECFLSVVLHIDGRLAYYANDRPVVTFATPILQICAALADSGGATFAVRAHDSSIFLEVSTRPAVEAPHDPLESLTYRIVGRMPIGHSISAHLAVDPSSKCALDSLGRVWRYENGVPSSVGHLKSTAFTDHRSDGWAAISSCQPAASSLIAATRPSLSHVDIRSGASQELYRPPSGDNITSLFVHAAAPRMVLVCTDRNLAWIDKRRSSHPLLTVTHSRKKCSIAGLAGPIVDTSSLPIVLWSASAALDSLYRFDLAQIESPTLYGYARTVQSPILGCNRSGVALLPGAISRELHMFTGGSDGSIWHKAWSTLDTQPEVNRHWQSGVQSWHRREMVPSVANEVQARRCRVSDFGSLFDEFSACKVSPACPGNSGNHEVSSEHPASFLEQNLGIASKRTTWVPPSTMRSSDSGPLPTHQQVSNRKRRAVATLDISEMLNRQLWSAVNPASPRGTESESQDVTACINNSSHVVLGRSTAELGVAYVDEVYRTSEKLLEAWVPGARAHNAGWIDVMGSLPVRTNDEPDGLQEVGKIVLSRPRASRKKSQLDSTTPSQPMFFSPPAAGYPLVQQPSLAAGGAAGSAISQGSAAPSFPETTQSQAVPGPHGERKVTKKPKRIGGF